MGIVLTEGLLLTEGLHTEAILAFPAIYVSAAQLRGGPFERSGDLARVGRHLLERSGTVEMLRTANEPDFRGGEIDHDRLGAIRVDKTRTCTRLERGRRGPQGVGRMPV